MVTLSQNSLYLLGLLTGVITGLMTGVAALIELLPGMKQQPEAFNWTVRGVNGALCLLAVMGVEAASNQFDLHKWVVYILAAGTMATGSHLLYVGTTARVRVKLSRATQASVPSDRAAQAERGPATFVA